MGAPIKDLAGKVFGNLTVAQFAFNKGGHAYWLCKCACGTEKAIISSSLITGTTKSCGCLKGKLVSDSIRKHGMEGTRIYNVWAQMLARCLNPKSKSFKRYGARGITVCDQWRRFENFMEWATSNGYADDLQIDRIDNNRGYSPENCRFVTAKQNQNNRQCNHLVTINGETKTIQEWSDITGIAWSTIALRVKKGKKDSEIIATPQQQIRRCRGEHLSEVG